MINAKNAKSEKNCYLSNMNRSRLKKKTDPDQNNLKLKFYKYTAA